MPSERVFVEELAPARTYGFLKDLELLRQQGLALGGSLDNAVVVGQERVLNGSLRFHDEFVRHKILDVIGDLTLVGRAVLGHVVARNAGHALNHLLVRELVKTARRWEDAAPRRTLLRGRGALGGRDPAALARRRPLKGRFPAGLLRRPPCRRRGSAPTQGL